MGSVPAVRPDFTPVPDDDPIAPEGEDEHQLDFDEGITVEPSRLWRGQPIPALLRYVPQRTLGYFVRVSIVDVLGRELYSVRAPIAWHRIYLLQGYEDRDPAETLVEEKLDRALEAVLTPIFEAYRSN
ncbi:hypothetical protein K2X89_11935 [Myxococcota bacterium]|nr:hypothetical protein [Myxococcota bacterium]